MKINSSKIMQIIGKIICFFVVFYVLFNASVNCIIFPFAIGMMYALVWANQKVWLVVPTYILAGVAHSATLEFSICLLVQSFAILFPYFVHVLCKKNMRKWEFGVYALVGQTANLVFDILGGVSPLVCAISLLLSVLFMFVCIGLFEAIIIRGFTNKLTNFEIVSLFCIIAVLCSGLAITNIATFSFLKLFVGFVLLVFAYCASPFLTLLVASTAGIGSLIATNNPLFVAPFVIWAVAVLLFKKRFRIFMVVALACVEVVIGFYFRLYATFSVVEALPLVIACVVFMVLPKKVYDNFAAIFNLSKDRLAMKNVVNRNREILYKRLGNLSEIFNDMNMIYRNMIKRGMSFEDAKVVLKQEICDKICSYCPERSHCLRTFADKTDQVFDQLVTVAYEKGKATVLDMPSFLTSRCKQTNGILGSINTLTSQYKKYIGMVKDVDTSKMIVADQLQGVSKIMGKLAKEVETNISFDTTLENKILDELTYYNIICIDAIVYEKDVWTQEVSVVVRNEDCTKPRIVDVVSKVCNCKMQVCDMFECSRPGYTIVNIKTAPKFDCLFAISQKTKSGSNVSGDTYSIVKLDGDKILFAISDGMGSGDKAESVSELAISLVENFYKAGFDNEIILSTVNKLLSLHKEEIFSALDLCVLDQRSGMLDFVKMASPCSYILNENECKKIQTGSLPLGIVEEISPLTNKQVASSKDFVILLSDGVCDSFETDEQLQETIKSIKTKNPQEFADLLLECALSQNNGYAVDDMTVVVVKILDF